MAELSSGKLRALLEVVSLYYEQNKTQAQIARLLHCSRPTVQRMLAEARARELVKIIIVGRELLTSPTARALEKRYGLDLAIAVPTARNDSGALINGIGAAAGKHVESLLRPGTVVGLTWGSTLAAMAESMSESTDTPGVQVVQLLGALGEPSAVEHAMVISRTMAAKLGATLHTIPAPGLVASQEARDSLLADRSVGQTLKLSAAADVMVVGIGAPTPDSIVRSAANLADDEIDKLVADGAVGDIALRFFDRSGRPVDSPFDRRVIGVTFEQLAAAHVVAVAGGAAKVDVIRAALRSGVVNTLITDEATAIALSEECGD